MISAETPALSAAGGEALRALLQVIEAAVNKAAPLLPRVEHRTALEAANELLLSRARAGRCRRYVRTLRLQITHALAGHLDRPVHAFTVADIEALADRWPGGARTRANFLAGLRTLFGFAVRRGYCVQNPAAGMERPTWTPAPVAIHTPSETARLLRVALVADPDAARFLAVCYFAGLRTAEAERLTEADIHPEHIEVSAANSKTRQRRIVPITPALRAWLDAGGRLPLVGCPKRIRAVKRAAGVQCPRNVARHSFCSYRLADTGSAARTALEAGHSEAMLFRHYRALVTPAEAERYWAIRPA